MFDGLLWAASLLMSCSLSSDDIINIGSESQPAYQRECRYLCQDKSVEINNTNKQYHCPKTLQVSRPTGSGDKLIYKRETNPNLYVPKTPWYKE